MDRSKLLILRRWAVGAALAFAVGLLGGVTVDTDLPLWLPEWAQEGGAGALAYVASTLKRVRRRLQQAQDAFEADPPDLADVLDDVLDDEG